MVPNHIEKAFFFEGSRRRRLYGFLHRGTFNLKDMGIVYCHPFAEERNMSHRIAAVTANEFASNGIPVLRFDFSGCGDSEDEFENISIEDMVSDIGYAVKELKKKTNVSQCMLWGLRLGAGLSLLHISRFGNIDGLMLWEPVLDFGMYINQFLRTRIATSLTKDQSDDISKIATGNKRICDGETVFINGYPITYRLYEEFGAIGKQPFKFIPDIPISVFSLSLLEKPNHMIFSYQEACKINPSASSFHLKIEPFWDRYWRWTCPELTKASLNWI